MDTIDDVYCLGRGVKTSKSCGAKSSTLKIPATVIIIKLTPMRLIIRIPSLLQLHLEVRDISNSIQIDGRITN
jgi:hypothetical protein